MSPMLVELASVAAAGVHVGQPCTMSHESTVSAPPLGKAENSSPVAILAFSLLFDFPHEGLKN